MLSLWTSDLHLTDRPRDEYRFGLFKWLAKQQVKHDSQATYLLGDVTDKKDNHPSRLVNRVVDEIKRLKPPVFILEGNHDYIDQANPFFRFLSNLEGVKFILKPTEASPGIFLIPHCPAQAEFDAACGQISVKPAVLAVHQTFAGSIAETGGALAGLSLSAIELLRPKACWAGDVHKPQRVGPVTYLGAPYHVRFGDNYTPRVVLADGPDKKNLFFDCPRKWSITIKDANEIANHEGLQAGDQIKIQVQLSRERIVEWATIRQQCIAECRNLGLNVYGVDTKIAATQPGRERLEQADSKTPHDVLAAYCKAERIGTAFKEAGIDLLDNQ